MTISEFAGELNTALADSNDFGLGVTITYARGVISVSGITALAGDLDINYGADEDMPIREEADCVFLIRASALVSGETSIEPSHTKKDTVTQGTEIYSVLYSVRSVQSDFYAVYCRRK